MDDRCRLRIELAASSSYSARWRPSSDGRWEMDMEQPSLFGSYQSDWTALLRILTAHLQWRRGLENVAQRLPVSHLLGGLPHQQGYPACGREKYMVNSSIERRSVVVASWNVRTLQDTGQGARRRIALIACELARCSAQFRILFIIAHIVADNASKALPTQPLLDSHSTLKRNSLSSVMDGLQRNRHNKHFAFSFYRHIQFGIDYSFVFTFLTFSYCFAWLCFFWNTICKKEESLQMQ